MVTVWIFVGTIIIGGKPIDVVQDIKYAYEDRATCEFVIKGSTMLRCVELRLVKK